MKTVMLVDDSPPILMSMEAILGRAGYGVIKAASGEEALHKLQGGARPNLVITDLNMAAMNGIERRAEDWIEVRGRPLNMQRLDSWFPSQND